LLRLLDYYDASTGCGRRETGNPSRGVEAGGRRDAPDATEGGAIEALEEALAWGI
jgi:hypothetical protein